MSPYRPAHDILCAHCAAANATAPCGRCKRLVCAPCGSDATTCLCAGPRRLELGRRMRVLAIDENARSVIAAGLWGRGRPHVIGLAQRSAAPLAVSAFGAFRRAFVCQFNTGAEAVLISTEETLGVKSTSLCRCGEHVARIHTDETISLAAVGASAGPRRETVRARVLAAVLYDCAAKQAFVATRAALHVFGCRPDAVDRRLSSVSAAKDCSEIGFAVSDEIVALAERRFQSVGAPGAFQFDYRGRLRVFRRHAQGLTAEPSFEIEEGEPPLVRSRGEPRLNRSIERFDVAEAPLLAAHASIAALVVAEREVLVIDCESGDIVVHRDHRRPVCFVGFAGAALATADTGGTLVVRELPLAP